MHKAFGSRTKLQHLIWKELQAWNLLKQVFDYGMWHAGNCTCAVSSAGSADHPETQREVWTFSHTKQHVSAADKTETTAAEGEMSSCRTDFNSELRLSQPLLSRLSLSSGLHELQAETINQTAFNSPNFSFLSSSLVNNISLHSCRNANEPPKAAELS